jgi:hypothetical protein
LADGGRPDRFGYGYAIRLFQAIKNGFDTDKIAKNDGLINVDGDTHRWLATPAMKPQNPEKVFSRTADKFGI